MKKFVSGLIVGMVIMFSTSAYGEDIVESLVGKQVEGTYPVTLNGTQLQKDAIVVEGSSYLPIRIISNAIGYDVDFKEDTGISLMSKSSQQENLIPVQYIHNVQTSNTVLKEIGCEFIEIDGNQYVSAKVLVAGFDKSLYKISYVKRDITFTNDTENITINIGHEYYSGIDGFTYKDTPFFKISKFGLKATVNGNTLIIEKQQ